MTASIWDPSTPCGARARYIPFDPTATISATNVQDAIEETDTENRALSAGLRADLLSTAIGKGSSIVGFRPIVTALALYRTAQDKLRETVSILDFDGADPTGATSSQTAMDAARAYIAASSTPIELVWPSGIYTYTTSPNWGIKDIKMTPLGTVRLRCIGTGDSIVVDAGPNAADLLWNVDIGRFLVEGASTSGHGIYIRSSHHSKFAPVIRGCGTTKAGYRVEFAVCSTFDDPTVSNNEGWYGTSVPLYGLSFGSRLPGETVSYCQVNRMVIEGTTSHGVYLEGTLGNLFLGGTSEGCYGWGVYATAGANNDKFLAVDYEVNTLGDVYNLGTALVFLECDSTGYIYMNGSYGTVSGGLHNTIEIGTGGKGTAINDSVYYRFLGPPQPSPDFITTASTASGNNILTLDTRGILRGMAVVGTNIPTGTIVEGVAGTSGCTTTTVRLSQNTTGIVPAGASINFGYQTLKTTNAISGVGTTRIFLASTTTLLVGMGLPEANAGIAPNTFITAVTGTYIDINNALTSTIASGVDVTIGLGVIGKFFDNGTYTKIDGLRNYNTTFNYLTARKNTVTPGAIQPLSSYAFTVDVEGAKLGDLVSISMSYVASSFIVEGRVTAANTVTVTMFNITGNTVTPGTITFVNVVVTRSAIA